LKAALLIGVVERKEIGGKAGKQSTQSGFVIACGALRGECQNFPFCRQFPYYRGSALSIDPAMFAGGT
jgi:hypothetical protein